MKNLDLKAMSKMSYKELSNTLGTGADKVCGCICVGSFISEEKKNIDETYNPFDYAEADFNTDEAHIGENEEPIPR
ncbi:MAG: hypothetical protein LKI53_05045 [Bacteroidales bacterium]|jgi:predicted class III extradiol MEMO1 family dioxygenase|nr:hypothetical protein [Bacteroidales bacterium]